MPTDAIPTNSDTVPIGRPLALDTPSPTPPADLLAGRYQLVRLVGHGGMGDVYEAEQFSPVRRTVAVKLVRRGPDGDDIAPRLEAERQALARMAHPNIAVVHDAGTAPDGRPFVVMEFVSGSPITDYADAHRLGVAERVELVRTVCAAVQHAHQKGIIHRDLKPGNVLVAHTDAGPVPKVIDFGLAKAVRSPLTDARMTTAGTIVGTPLYMAPEQTDPAADVDTRADVFALGVILYELLAGTTPLDALSFQRADPVEQFRMIRTIAPPPPSTRAGATLAKQLRGDLDAVTLKALSRDPSDRYPTAAALADDLRRVLADEPVSIGRTTARTRAMRFIRRNRAAVATLVLVILALGTGVAGTTIGLFKSRRAEADTRAALEQVEEKSTALAAALARVEAEKAETAAALRREADERKRVSVARDQTREALMAATDLQSVALVLQAPSLTDADRARLTHLATLIDKLDADAVTQVERSAMLARVGFLYEKLGDQPKAADANARAVAAADLSGDPILRGGTRMKQARHFGLLGRLPEADAAYRAAVELFTPLADDPAATSGLIEAHEGLAQMHEKAGRYPEAVAESKKAIALAEAAKAAGRLHPDALQYLAQSHYHLGAAARNAGNGGESLAHIQAALAVYRSPEFKVDRAESIHSLAGAHLNLAPALSLLDRLPEAKAASLEAIRLAEDGLARYPGYIDLRMLLGTASNNLGGMYAIGGEYREALPHFQRGVEVLEPLAAGRAADRQAVAHYLAMGRFGRGMTRFHLGDAGGVEDVRKAVAAKTGPERLNLAMVAGTEAHRAGAAGVVAALAADLRNDPTPGAVERAAYLFALSTTLRQSDEEQAKNLAAAIAAIRLIPAADLPRAAVQNDPRLYAFRKRPGVADALAGKRPEEAPPPRVRN